MRAIVRARNVFIAFLVLNAAIAFAYLTDNSVYGPPLDYSSPTLHDRGSSYVDAVFNSGGVPTEWIRRISDAASTPRVDGVPGNLSWISHEYSTTSPFNSDNTRVLLIHIAYFALYDTDGNLIRQLTDVCPLCAPRWSRTDPAVFYYVRNGQMFSYNTTSDVRTPLGPQLPYDEIISKGEDDICFDGDHLIGFGRRGETYYLYVFSVAASAVIAEAPLGNSAAFNNIDSAEIAPNDIVIVTYAANDQMDTKAPGKGIWSFTLGLTPLQQISTAEGHHDVGMDIDGSPILVMTNSASYHPLPGCPNGIEKIRILNPELRTCLLPLHWTLAVHVSLPDQAGWAFVSTHNAGDPIYGSLGRKEELFPTIAYSGRWTLDSNAANSNDHARLSDTKSSRMSYFFYGTQIQWIGRKDASSGMADVTLDGQTTRVDTYSRRTAFQSVIYSRNNLAPGFHSLTIDVAGQKNRFSWGYRVWVDALQDDSPWTTYTNEILMVRLDGSETRRLLHHRSRPYNTYNYQPRVSVSHDGTRLVFASNYGLPVDAYTSYADAYLAAVDLQSMNALTARNVRPGFRTARAPNAEVPAEVPDVPLTPEQRARINEYLYPRQERGSR